MFCIKCGHQLPSDANFCLNCGVPQKQGVQTPSQLKVEYRQEFLDWAKSPMIIDHMKEPPHPESGAIANANISKRVLHEIQPLLDKGWVLDGPYDSAVKWLAVDKTSKWSGGNRARLDGIWVKLRRISSHI